jgi:DNA invertase Pin-like site-specific DNA recombinase
LLPLAVPQPQLPIFSDDCTLITPELGFQRFDGRVIYFNGQMPVFSHACEDIASFRMFTSQLVANGSASQSQIAKAFGVPLITVKRMCVKLRDEGPAGFFKPKEPVKGHKLTPERIDQAQGMLDGGAAVPEISAAIGVLQTTLHKAISAGRLKKSLSPPLR